MGNLSYVVRLKLAFNIYSHQRRSYRYCAIYVGKILEGQDPNLSEKIVKSNMHVPVSHHLGTLCHHPSKF